MKRTSQSLSGDEKPHALLPDSTAYSLDVVLLLDFPKVFADSFPDGVLLWLIIVLFFHFFLLFNCCLQLSPSSKWKGSS